jgi:hypothetical protein
MDCHGTLQRMTVLMVGVLCLGACAAPTATPTTIAAPSVSIPPTATSTSVPPTATPIPRTPTALLTSTPRLIATSTPVPLSAQARAFAEPILKAIANRPPDYQDDFGNPKTGWPVLARHDGEFDGEMGYSDGEYFLLASPSTPAHRWIHSWLQVPNLEVSDFVLDLDARFVTAESLERRSGMFYVHFRARAKDVNSVTLTTDRVTEVGTETREKTATLATFRGDPVKSGANHLRIIARRPQIAVYVNGQPLFVGQDYSPDRGPVILGIANAGKVPLEVHLDNLQVWDISKLSLP